MKFFWKWISYKKINTIRFRKIEKTNSGKKSSLYKNKVLYIIKEFKFYLFIKSIDIYIYIHLRKCSSILSLLSIKKKKNKIKTLLIF